MLKLTGNEKAFVGGLLAFASTSFIQLQQSVNGYTLKDFGWSVAAWVVVHLGIWLTTNTPVSPDASGTPVAPPTNTPTASVPPQDTPAQ